MNLYVLFGQRICAYPGEYALEALACASEADMDGNPDYIPEEEAKHKASGDFDRLSVITLNVSEAEIRSIMYPENTTIGAQVVRPASAG